MDDTIVNIGLHLRRSAERYPYRRAVIQPTGRDRQGRSLYRQLTFRDLDQDSDRLAHGLTELGIRRGTRTILMVTPCLDFFVLIFGLFKAGVVPVVVDPGMGISRMLNCLNESRPEAFIGIPKAHLLRFISPRRFRTVKTWVVVGPPMPGATRMSRLMRGPYRPFPIADTHKDEMATIVFTTGSTGPAKGAVYTHGNFDAQIRQIQDHFEIADGEIDLPTFPLFALFDPALGMTAVIPRMDPTRPGHVNPERIIGPILEHGVTNMFGSPALLERVGPWGRDRGVKLPSLRRVVSAGAPVLPENIARFAGMLEGEGQVYTPYGATEAVPITIIGSREILAETRGLSEGGAGTCVGRPLSHTTMRVIRITDDPIPEWSGVEVCPTGTTGEIVVSGDLVTTRYFEDPKSDAVHKIRDGERTWHRMGDVGYFDEKGRLWFCGRKSHRVVTPEATLFTVCCEAIFNGHPEVRRSALVGVGGKGRQTPVIVIEIKAGATPDRQRLTRELLDLAAGHEHTRLIRTVLYHPGFPVDIRHNSKIFRERLAVWAAGRQAGQDA